MTIIPGKVTCNFCDHEIDHDDRIMIYDHHANSHRPDLDFCCDEHVVCWYLHARRVSFDQIKDYVDTK